MLEFDQKVQTSPEEQDVTSTRRSTMCAKKKGISGEVPVRYMVEDPGAGETKTGKKKKKTVEFAITLTDAVLPDDDQIQTILLGALSQWWSSSHPSKKECIVDDVAWSEVAKYFEPSVRSKSGSQTPAWVGAVKKAFTTVCDKKTVTENLGAYKTFEDVPQDIQTVAQVIMKRQKQAEEKAEEEAKKKEQSKEK